MTVRAADAREREGTLELLERCAAALLRGVPCGERRLRPEGLETEGDTLSFSLAVCALVPREGEAAPEVMRRVHVEGL